MKHSVRGLDSKRNGTKIIYIGQTIIILHKELMRFLGKEAKHGIQKCIEKGYGYHDRSGNGRLVFIREVGAMITQKELNYGTYLCGNSE